MGGRFDIRCYDGYKKKVSISQKQAPAVRKVYRTCEQQNAKHQRCERCIERVHLILLHDIPFAPLGLILVISTFSIYLSSLWDLAFYKDLTHMFLQLFYTPKRRVCKVLVISIMLPVVVHPNMVPILDFSVCTL